jgi:hypothetical protein
MKRELSAATRERMRAVALSMPRNALGVFIKKTRIGDGSNSERDVERAPSPIKTVAFRKAKLSRKALVARVSTSVEREHSAVEQLLRETNTTAALDAETERRARTLASLTRTLRELSQLQQAEAKPKADDDDAIPRDIDELRRELARRLDRLIADAKAVHPDLPRDTVDGTAD